METNEDWESRINGDHEPRNSVRCE